MMILTRTLFRVYPSCNSPPHPPQRLGKMELQKSNKVTLQTVRSNRGQCPKDRNLDCGHFPTTCNNGFWLGNCAVNCYTQWFAGSLACPASNASTLDQYQVAKERLLRYNFVVIVEKLNDRKYVDAVERFFGVRGANTAALAYCQKSSMMANAMVPLHFENETLEQLRRLNQVDINLYREISDCLESGHNALPKWDPSRFDVGASMQVQILHEDEQKDTHRNVNVSLIVVPPLQPQTILTITKARSHKLTPISPNTIDDTQYTLRINTWRRNEQLIISLNHHSKCEGVHEIQVIWCDTENSPPTEILHHSSGKVKIEFHEVNSLNERFNAVEGTPTLGVLSLDDDVLRPCDALDAAFVRWMRHPERLV